MKRPLKMMLDIRGTYDSLEVGDNVTFSVRDISESNLYSTMTRCKPKKFKVQADREALTFTLTRIE